MGNDAGVMTRSIKPWDKVSNVPCTFVFSGVAMGETECVSSVTVNVVLVHSAPNDVRITLTRVGKQSAAPRATNVSTTILLLDFDSGTPTSGIFDFCFLLLLRLFSLFLFFLLSGLSGFD
jgi:hypothetical protein